MEPQPVASRAWTDEETQVLRSVAESPTWFAAASSVLVDRSRSALVSQMCMVRREMGVKVKRGRRSEDDWTADAAAASADLLEATLRVGRWS